MAGALVGVAALDAAGDEDPLEADPDAVAAVLDPPEAGWNWLLDPVPEAGMAVPVFWGEVDAADALCGCEDDAEALPPPPEEELAPALGVLCALFAFEDGEAADPLEAEPVDDGAAPPAPFALPDDAVLDEVFEPLPLGAGAEPLLEAGWAG